MIVLQFERLVGRESYGIANYEVAYHQFFLDEEKEKAEKLKEEIEAYWRKNGFDAMIVCMYETSERL